MNVVRKFFRAVYFEAEIILYIDRGAVGVWLGCPLMLNVASKLSPHVARCFLQLNGRGT